MLNLTNDEAVKEVMKKIYHYLVKIGSNPEDAKDIVQDSLYKAMVYIDSIEDEKMSSWLFKVSINHYYDLCRKKQKMDFSILDEELASNQKLTEEVLLDKENQYIISQVLNKMSPTFKQLLLMKYEMGLSYKEIGALLDTNQDKIKTYLSRAREQFKKLYGGYDYE